MLLPGLNADALQQWCSGIIHTDDVLTFINYLSFSAFAVLRVYAIWDQDWKPLVFVIPLSLVKPILVLVCGLFCPCASVKL